MPRNNLGITSVIWRVVINGLLPIHIEVYQLDSWIKICSIEKADSVQL